MTARVLQYGYKEVIIDVVLIQFHLLQTHTLSTSIWFTHYLTTAQ